jgi:hypothetical protein
MQENKNLVQEALIQMKNVEEAIAQNAKGILASTMKEEINQLVKESLSEQDMEDEVELDVDMDDDTEDVDMDTDNEDEMDMELDMDMDIDSEESPIDLTDASDEEILRVFKAMGEEDGIIVKKDGEDIHLSDEDADVEYLVKLGESEEQEEELDEIMDLEEMDFESDETRKLIDTIFSSKGDVDNIDFESDEDEVMFEIEMEEESDEYMEDEYMEDDMEDDMEEEVMYEIEMEEDMDDDGMMEEDDDEMGDDDLDESYDHRRAVREAKSTVKPKGVGIGKGPKFSYEKTKGGFPEKKKEGPKSVGTGKAKFEYKEGGNMEGKSKVVKAETKEGAHGGNKFDKSKTHGGEDYTTKKGDTLKTKAFEKEETKEAARTYGMGSKEGRGLRKGITPNRNYVYGKGGVRKESLDPEVATLREKNEEYRKALNVFREKLNEVAIFNSNLAYATRLFTEHSTTKKEKINILRRFDNVETLKESKNLYKSIKDELSTSESTPINESVETKLNKNVSSGSSTTLIESKTYENPQFLRMKDLMSKIG